MGFDLDVTIPAITVFLQGILSFLSPCILPIIPLYMGYLSGGAYELDENGQQIIKQKTIFINTLFFIFGVSFAFFILALGFSTLGTFFTQNQMVFSRVGGIFIIVLGLMQLGIFDKPFQGKEYKLPIQIDVLQMSPITALIMGFTFSFAWTPCVGPALSSVLIMISSSSSTYYGMVLMGVYTIGFTLPFLLLGIFTTACLNFFRKYNGVVAYTVKIGGVIMIAMGLMMFTGTMNRITSYMSDIITVTSDEEDDIETEATTELDEEELETADEVTDAEEESTEAEEETVEVYPAVDFELEDQYGNIHTLSDYEGKVIFLNIWATWCSPCQAELPDIQALYEAYGYNEEDVIVLGVAFPNDENAYTQDGSKQDIIEFLESNDYTYPTLMDMEGVMLWGYGISAFPTTFMIDAEGNLFGYVSGMMTYDIMVSIMEQTIEGN